MSRGLTYWNDQTIGLIKARFVAVAVPTWVARAEGPEGDFLRGADLHQRWVTSSGYMNCVSAGGVLLGGRPTSEVLDAFEQLPEAQRKPEAVLVPDLDPSRAVIPSPPEDGLVLRVHARFLAREPDGPLRRARTTDFPLMRENPRILESWKLFLQPNTECMWIQSDEWRALVPRNPVVGQRIVVDPAITQRLTRFHLNPKRATTSEGGIVHPKAVQEAHAEIVIENITPGAIEMRLEGRVHWGSDFDQTLATTPDGPLPLGYQSTLTGQLTYDRQREKFTLFDLVAPGEVWGRWGDANGKSMYVERPGREPFGFALELATGDSPTDRIPPGGNGRYVTERTGYFPAAESPK